MRRSRAESHIGGVYIFRTLSIGQGEYNSADSITQSITKRLRLSIKHPTLWPSVVEIPSFSLTPILFVRRISTGPTLSRSLSLSFSVLLLLCSAAYKLVGWRVCAGRLVSVHDQRHATAFSRFALHNPLERAERSHASCQPNGAHTHRNGAENSAPRVRLIGFITENKSLANNADKNGWV